MISAKLAIASSALVNADRTVSPIPVNSPPILSRLSLNSSKPLRVRCNCVKVPSAFLINPGKVVNASAIKLGMLALSTCVPIRLIVPTVTLMLSSVVCIRPVTSLIDAVSPPKVSCATERMLSSFCATRCKEFAKPAISPNASKGSGTTSPLAMKSCWPMTCWEACISRSSKTPSRGDPEKPSKRASNSLGSGSINSMIESPLISDPVLIRGTSPTSNSQVRSISNSKSTPPPRCLRNSTLATRPINTPFLRTGVSTPTFGALGKLTVKR